MSSGPTEGSRESLTPRGSVTQEQYDSTSPHEQVQHQEARTSQGGLGNPSNLAERQTPGGSEAQ